MPKSNFKFDWPLVGNREITEFLSKCLNNNSVSGAYIFNGPDNLGKTTVASHFAKSLLCRNFQISIGELPCGNCPSCRSLSLRHPDKTSQTVPGETGGIHGDLHLVKKDKDKKNVSVEQVRGLIKTLSMSSFLNSYKIGIIKHADSMSEKASNALLKTLEEPNPMVVIILITHDAENIPSTIISRSQILNFRPVSSDTIYKYLLSEYRASRSLAKNLSRLCLGRSALAVKFFEDKNFYENYREKVTVFLNFVSQPIYKRIQAVPGLLGPKISGQETVVIAKRVLEVWLGVVRDALLLGYGHNNLIQHHEAESDIRHLAQRFNNIQLTGIYRRMILAQENLQANVSPLLVLEDIAISL